MLVLHRPTQPAVLRVPFADRRLEWARHALKALAILVPVGAILMANVQRLTRPDAPCSGQVRRRSASREEGVEDAGLPLTPALSPLGRGREVGARSHLEYPRSHVSGASCRRGER